MCVAIFFWEITVNTHRAEGNWKQFKGKVKEQWGKLTNDDLDIVAGQTGLAVG